MERARKRMVLLMVMALALSLMPAALMAQPPAEKPAEAPPAAPPAEAPPAAPPAEAPPAAPPAAPAAPAAPAVAKPGIVTTFLWIDFVLGLWVIVAAWVMRPEKASVKWNGTIVGIIIAVLSIIAALR